jgi:hypothetical protein
MVRHPTRGPFPLTPANVKIELLKTYQTEPALEAARDISHQRLRHNLHIGRFAGVIPRRFGTMQAIKNHQNGITSGVRHHIGYDYIFDGNDGNWSVLAITLPVGDYTRELRHQHHCRFVEAMGGTMVNDVNVGELCCSEGKWLISRYSSRFRVKLSTNW